MMERMQILTPRGRIGIGERLLLTSSWVVGWIRIVEVLWQLVHSVKLSGDDDVCSRSQINLSIQHISEQITMRYNINTTLIYYE